MKIKDFLLERFFAEHEFNVPHLLCASDCQTFSVEELCAGEEGGLDRLRALRLGYTDSRGAEELRAEVSSLYQTVTPDQIIIFSGAEEGIFAFVSALFERGDHLIVQYPAYQSLYEVALAAGCAVTRWTCREERGWSLDLDFLTAGIKPNTKGIIINNPHNPTGSLMGADDFREVAGMAEDRGILLFSDEVYRLLEYDEARRLPAAADLSPTAFSLGVMSKSFGLAGLRIGWIATRNGHALERLAAFKDYTSICAGAPSELLAAFALRKRGMILDRNLRIISENLALLDRFFARHAGKLAWVRPVAGPIAFPRLDPPLGAEKFCMELKERQGVLLLPSTLFGFGDSHLRIGFGRKDMPAALARFDEHLESMP